MRNLRVMLPLIAAVGVFPAVAMADVEVRADVEKRKDIRIVERIDIEKRVVIEAQVGRRVQKAAEADALMNQTNRNNEVCTNCDEKRDTILNSGNFSSGVLSLNQSAGNMNNQGNAVSVAVDVQIDVPPSQRDPADEGFADAQAHVDQRNFENAVNTVNILFRNARIENSINNNSGVAHVNQAPGNMANQSNTLALAVSLARGGVALAEADLGQVNTRNVVRESDAGGDRESPGFVGINKRADIIGSVNNNTGVVGVNQSAGNMANQANVVAFSSTGFAR